MLGRIQLRRWRWARRYGEVGSYLKRKLDSPPVSSQFGSQDKEWTRWED